jgi:hypothetical protein
MLCDGEDPKEQIVIFSAIGTDLLTAIERLGWRNPCTKVESKDLISALEKWGLFVFMGSNSHGEREG